MSTYTKFINIVNNFSSEKSLSNNDKILMKNNLNTLSSHVDKKENEIINSVLISLNKNRLTKDDKQVIIVNKKIIIKIVTKYGEQFNEKSNEDNIIENNSIECIENELDAKIKKYNGFSTNHPMHGITYDNNKSKYMIQYNKIKKFEDNITIASNIILENFKRYKNSDKIGENIPLKNFFNYKDHYFVIYWQNDKPLFDIQHIISILNLKYSSYLEKYNQFSDQIIFYTWHKNKYDGYIFRELISETTVFEIILSSNSTISKSFKKDISKILSDLRKEGNLEITNDKISKKKLKKYENIDEEKDTQIRNMIDKTLSLSYDNPVDMMQLYILINQLSYIPISLYINQSVLYAFIVTLKRNHTKVIIKFGWSLDILTRIKDLQNEYGSNFYLIGLKRIKNELIEKQFHKILRFKFPDSIENVCIKSKDKIELYKFNMLMMTEFDAVEEDHTKNILDIVLSNKQKILVETIRNQHIIFNNIIISQLNLNNIISKTSDENVINNCAVIHYNFLTIQSNNIHNQTIKKMQIEDDQKKRDFKLNKLEINKEIRLKELEIEIYKLKHI